MLDGDLPRKRTLVILSSVLMQGAVTGLAWYKVHIFPRDYQVTISRTGEIIFVLKFSKKTKNIRARDSTHSRSKLSLYFGVSTLLQFTLNLAFTTYRQTKLVYFIYFMNVNEILVYISMYFDSESALFFAMFIFIRQASCERISLSHADYPKQSWPKPFPNQWW